MSVQIHTKVAVTVAAMARMVGLSRARFYQLMKAGAFPSPLKKPETNRPFYSEDLQLICLEVRQRNCGIDGKPILFYARRYNSAPPRAKIPKPKEEAKRGDVSALLDGLNALGLTTVTGAQIQRVTEELYPNGTEAMDQSQVLRAVFLHLKRQDSGDSVGR